MKKYAWDFVGPRAEMIARHHLKHVEDFLAREKIAGCECGITVESPMRATAWCHASESSQPLIERALRPPRIMSD